MTDDDLIREGTPEGFQWKLRIEECFGNYSLRITLLHRNRIGLATRSWTHRYNITGDATLEEFRKYALRRVLDVLNNYKEAMARPTLDDLEKLTEELQKLLNQKS